MKKLKLKEEQQKFLENNFNNFSEELINSTFQFVIGGEKKLNDFCTMEGIERQLAKANCDNMTAAFIFYAHMYYPEKWRIEKMAISSDNEVE
jgi:hypothetical protein